MKTTLKVVPKAAPAGNPIEPLTRLKLLDVVPGSLPEPPELRWIELDRLRINRAYQRELTRTSVRLIRGMVERFDWARLKALSVLEIGGGLYEVLDGQHTAIAAVAHGGVDRVPCLVCAKRPPQEAAAAFVDLNTQRLALTPMQIFWGEVAAGDELACEVVEGVKRGGGQVCRSQIASASWKFGDTIAVSALKKLAARGGAPYVKRVTALGVAAKLRPITRDFVVAFDQLIWGRHSGKAKDERIVDIIRIHGAVKLVNDARRLQEDGTRRTLADHLADVIARLA